MPHTDAVVILTTVSTPEEGERLVRALLERRLIACGSLLPGSRSLYRWEGKIADEQETVILMKTRSAVLHAVEKAFAESTSPIKQLFLAVTRTTAFTRRTTPVVEACTQ